MSYTVTEHSYEDICEMQQMANTIRKQIGLSNLMACGAREYSFLGFSGIKFKVNHGRARQYMTIVLTARDDYNVELRKITKDGEKILERAEGVYCENIGDVVYHMVNK